MSNSQKIYYEILDKNQKLILPKLKFLKNHNFYLAGGTALTLQINHRPSIDFDFYTNSDFNPENLYTKFKNKFENLKLIHIKDGTLILTVDNVMVSLFSYKYNLLKPLLELKNIFLCSLEDISAMKIIAIVQRGLKRDFVDVYYLLKIFGLNKIIEFTQKKYPDYDKYLILKSLLYFEDAEKENDFRKEKHYFKNVSWKIIKKEILNTVKNYLKKEKVEL